MKGEHGKYSHVRATSSRSRVAAMSNALSTPEGGKWRLAFLNSHCGRLSSGGAGTADSSPTTTWSLMSISVLSRSRSSLNSPG
jgi:hypothetical protein